MTDQEAREKIDGILCRFCYGPEISCNKEYESCPRLVEVKSALSAAGVVQLDEDQTTPCTHIGLEALDNFYDDGIEDMLKAGWRKVKPLEEK